MPDQYLFVSDKWDKYMIEDEKGVEWAALDLLRQRVGDGFWYHDDDAEMAQEIVANEDAKRALRFLLNRVDYEYEYVEVKYKR